MIKRLIYRLVTSESEVMAFFVKALEQLGPISTLIVCHGIWPSEDISVKDMSLDRWRNTVSVNLDGTFLFCRYVHE